MPEELERWADAAMYRAEDRPDQGAESRVGFIAPRVTLLGMTHDPLGHIAAGAGMYEGRVFRRLSDVSRSDRERYLAEMQKTKLAAPLELVNFHFLLENVTRSFTHQLVRQRTAVYMQESLRFAVKEHIDEDVSVPPSLRGLADDDPRRVIWQKAVNVVDDAYTALVSAGVPAEDARGLLPHNLVTRVHYATNLRALLDHAGNRLCTQAQFEWRLVFSGIAQAIRMYNPLQQYAISGVQLEDETRAALLHVGNVDKWQYQAIADLLRPVCYQTGHCVFLADFDRYCSIRQRVQEFAKRQVPSSEWAEGYNRNHEHARDRSVQPISNMEWLLDPGAAIRRPV